MPTIVPGDHTQASGAAICRVVLFVKGEIVECHLGLSPVLLVLETQR
jgi:hypothetical protein